MIDDFRILEDSGKEQRECKIAMELMPDPESEQAKTLHT
jgi:hypothetical protein